MARTTSSSSSSRTRKRLSAPSTPKWTLQKRGLTSTLDIALPTGATGQSGLVRIEDGCILKMTPSVDLQMVRNFSGFFTQQSIVQIHAHATGPHATLSLAPHTYGDIELVDLSKCVGRALHIMKACYLASSGEVSVNATTAKSLTSALFSSGLFLMHATAPAHTTRDQSVVAIHSSGHIERLRVTPQTPIKIDAGHVVAWDGGVTYSMVKAASTWFSTVLSGEGLMCFFEGDGYVYVQSRRSIAEIARMVCQR